MQMIAPSTQASLSRVSIPSQTRLDSNCGLPLTNVLQGYSYYAHATAISPEFYQTLLDRSWRRSGNLLYRPNQRKSCCPHYTIRLDSNEFKPTKSQRQVVNRFNNFVLGENYIKDAARLHPRSREQAKARETVFILTERIHEAEYARLETPPEPAHKLEVTLESNAFTEEKYLVYNNYQKEVHKDPPSDRTRPSFKRFLCSSPLRARTELGEGGRVKRLGSYHQCYRLDGKLVAVGILDLLPQCVSSVYFMYDESITRFGPGKLSALGEISLASEGGYRWWYPGFYIHSCPKMRYKMDYTPQMILDPEALTWDPLDKAMLNLLDQKPYVSKSREQRGETPGESETTDDLYGDESSLFGSGLPGIATISKMESVDLDGIPVKCWKDIDVLMQTPDLGGWNKGGIRASQSVKLMVAEMVAALGPDCVPKICLDFAEIMDD